MVVIHVFKQKSLFFVKKFNIKKNYLALEFNTGPGKVFTGISIGLEVIAMFIHILIRSVKKL